MRTRASGRTFLTALMVTALAVLLVSPVSAANPAGSLSKAPKAPERIKVPSGVIAKLGASLSSAKGNVSVFVELAHPGAADVYSAKLSSGKKAAKAAANAAKVTTNRSATAVVASLKSKDRGAKELFRTANAVSGVAVIGDAAQIRALAGRSDVKSIRLLIPKKIDNAHSAELINVLATWQDLGVFGAGVRVGVIDTGIDYTHANFGGPGTPAAYNGVNRTGSTPLFPSAKVVGGTDLAGEDYNASSANPAQFTPHPDGNPLDCDNHGSHVAGTTAGFGENPDGSTFTGDYSTLTQSSIEAMKIGPGMAPKALLYAIKVFGCPGGAPARRTSSLRASTGPWTPTATATSAITSPWSTSRSVATTAPRMTPRACSSRTRSSTGSCRSSRPATRLTCMTSVARRATRPRP